MKWLDDKTSLYVCQADNFGRPATYREILLCDFGVPHEWYYKEYKPVKHWVSGIANDLDTMVRLRSGGLSAEDIIRLKGTMQCYCPSALLETKQKDNVKLIRRTSMLQLDWDKDTCQHHNIEELKKLVFELPFIAYCGLSCTARGFYALAMIAEPDRLEEYAEHLFVILEREGLKVDTSKGSNLAGLRYLSYDCNGLFREDPTPLRVKHFKTRSKASTQTNATTSEKIISADKVINKAIQDIQNAEDGYRIPTIQRWAYSLGGMQDNSALDAIKNAITHSENYAAGRDRAIQCAVDCYNAGKATPFKK